VFESGVSGIANNEKPNLDAYVSASAPDAEYEVSSVVGQEPHLAGNVVSAGSVNGQQS
jgi:hypothetical protein